MNFTKTHAVTAAKGKLVAKRGMFIKVQPDGWAWSDTERSPAYTIKKLPGVDVNDATIQNLIEPARGEWGPDELALPEEHRPPKPIVGRRVKKVDLDTWTKADDDFVENETNTVAQRVARLVSKCTDVAIEIM
jgi:hypothetical protein